MSFISGLRTLPLILSRFLHLPPMSFISPSPISFIIQRGWEEGGRKAEMKVMGGPKMKDSPSLSSWRHRNESFYEISKTGTQSLSVLSEGDSPPGATLLVAP